VPGSSLGRSGSSSRAVIDASVAVKWVVAEQGTAAALALRTEYGKLLAPDLLVPECANVLWKKVVRGNLLPAEARIAARLIASAEIELIPMRAYLESATALAVELSHPAYDCIYLAVAKAQRCPFITCDEGFIRKLEAASDPSLKTAVLLLR
jgi:predicted nucleic acid-binding protein